MSDSIFKVESLGSVTVTNHKGETIELRTELIIHMAREIRSALDLSGPPEPYFSVSIPKPVLDPRGRSSDE